LGTLKNDDGSALPFKVEFSAGKVGWYTIGELESCEATGPSGAATFNGAVVSSTSASPTLESGAPSEKFGIHVVAVCVFAFLVVAL
jgi:hypothetical protein